MMLATFPTPYPDELLYSLCARYTARMRFSSANIAAEALFGTRGVVAVVDLPSRLDLLSSRLPKALGLDPDTLITNHTLLPLYAPFISRDRLDHIRRLMLGKGGARIHSSLGIMASRVPTLKKLRFCPECVKDERSKYGECYWHRVHHIAGINICAHHGCSLEESTASFQRTSTYYSYTAAEENIPEVEFASSFVANPHLHAIANQAYWLLNNTFEGEAKDIYFAYRVNLEFRELTTVSGSTRQQQLRTAFLDFYTPELLDSVCCSFEDAHETWLARILRGDREAHHPVRHLLVLHFFGHTPGTALRIPYAGIEPFGCGPWPCLNAVCPQLHQDTIATCDVKRSRYTGNRPIAVFACPLCGFTYTRTGPDKDSQSRYQIGRILAFGPLWEEKLVALLQERALSLRAMSRTLGVDTNTVRRHSQRLLFSKHGESNHEPKDNYNPSSEAMSTTDLLHSHRQTWLNAIEVFPYLGVSALRRQFSATYAWLSRHDKLWLDRHSLATLPRSFRPTRVAWTFRDELLATVVQEAALRLISQQESPKRMTLTSIGREAGCVMVLQQHLNKLPQTAERLKSLVESREQWAVRKLQWTINQVKEQGIVLKGWEIVRRSGLGRFPREWFELHGVEF